MKHVSKLWNENNIENKSYFNFNVKYSKLVSSRKKNIQFYNDLGGTLLKKTFSIVHKICYLQSSYYKIIPEGVKFTSTLIHDSCKPTIQRFWFHF